MKHRRHLSICTIALFVTTLGGPTPSSGKSRVVFVASPHSSLTKTRKLLDAIDVRIMLPLGYDRAPDRNRSKLGDRGGVVDSRVFVHQGGEFAADSDWMEIAIIEGVEGGYDFALFAPQVDGPSDAVFDEVVDDVDRISRKRGSYGPEAPDIGYEMFQLGYIEVDRALAMLKALGYNTVEFSLSSKSKDQQIFESVKGKSKKLPKIIKVVNASKTSLLDFDGRKSARSSSKASKSLEGAPMLGGSHLHSTTAGAPEERLLLVYDRNEPEKLEELVNLLQSQIDVAAQQIVIEALVIEINTTNLQDLGVDFSASKKHASGSFQRTTGGKSLGTFIFSRDAFTNFTNFNATLEALTERGDAEVLSSPSVLVLNDRQARIQWGDRFRLRARPRSPPRRRTRSRGLSIFPSASFSICGPASTGSGRR